MNGRWNLFSAGSDRV
ncbi:hypothetical protein A2U01_0106612, partial [Trifolium medium]|nr:hypothetical protein [Trifolium medium]